jgi:lipase ATG15
LAGSLLPFWVVSTIHVGKVLFFVVGFGLNRPSDLVPLKIDLVSMVNALQSNVAQRVAFYKVVTPFLEHLKKDSDYGHIAVTGHSLGGGIAIISGAQAKIPAIAISGPNALLSGRSFEPPVLEDALDRYTFNVRPDRDIVPRFDDVAQNFQNIRCVNDNLGNIATCHNPVRTLCELSYNCGTGSRPAFCECHTVFGYPKPLSTVDGVASFDELCVNATSLSGSPSVV